MDYTIVECDGPFGPVCVVRKDDGTYDVSSNNEVKHPACSAESAMRALATYLQASVYANKSKNPPNANR